MIVQVFTGGESHTVYDRVQTSLQHFSWRRHDQYGSVYIILLQYFRWRRHWLSGRVHTILLQHQDWWRRHDHYVRVHRFTQDIIIMVGYTQYC